MKFEDEDLHRAPAPREVIDAAGINVIWADANAGRDKAAKLVMRISELQREQPKNAFIALKEWRKLGDAMIDYLFAYGEILFKVAKQQEQLFTNSKEKRHKRWTPEEDELLIDLVCSDMNPFEIVATMGRTPSAIKSRVSKLVGLKRISQEVAGRFVGTIDGNAVDGNISGTVYMGDGK